MLNHKGTKELETERLVLRKFTEEDASDMYNNWASDPEVTKFLTWSAHKNIEVTKDLIYSWIEEYNNIDSYQWAIEMKENRKVIGSISLFNIDKYVENCEAGYCIGKAFWGQGIVTEVFSAIIKFCFDEINFKRVTARHEVGNYASGRVMEKCGLKYEGLFRKISKDGTGALVDCKYYSILENEYRALYNK